jgi:hypothetical protein
LMSINRLWSRWSISYFESSGTMTQGQKHPEASRTTNTRSEDLATAITSQREPLPSVAPPPQYQEDDQEAGSWHHCSGWCLECKWVVNSYAADSDCIPVSIVKRADCLRLGKPYWDHMSMHKFCDPSNPSLPTPPLQVLVIDS